MTSYLPLSVIVITHNEESNIERCLSSVDWVDDIVVVDSHSTDRTVELAKKHKAARVTQQKWLGFGAQKNFAASLARHPWILSLDADEALSPELSLEIQNKFSELKPHCGYIMPRLSFHLGKWIRYGGWYPDYQLRLYHRNHAQWSTNEVHEKVQIEHKEKLTNNLLHWVFTGISDQVLTNDKYSSLGAQQLIKEQKSFSIFWLLSKPLTKFIETYFIKKGFYDGLPGFIISIGAAYSVFLKWAKLWELTCLKNTKSQS